MCKIDGEYNSDKEGRFKREKGRKERKRVRLRYMNSKGREKSKSGGGEK